MAKMIPITGGGKPDVIKESARQMRDHMGEYMELMAQTAKLHRAKYLALKKEGFSDTEALELCKVIISGE